MSITLITDSTCDLSPELLAELGVRFASLKVLFKDTEYIDKVDLTNSEFYEKMKKSSDLPTTSQVNPNEFYELFSDELKKGNQVIGIFISSDLSGTYNSATIAKEMIGQEDITLIDSRNVSFALGLMVIKIQQFINNGMSVPEIVLKANEMIERAQLYGMLDTLDNLRKGGRLSSGTALIGKMLNLKPIIEVKDGLVGVVTKARGSRKGLAWMIDQIRNEFPEGVLVELAIAHGNDLENLQDLKLLLLEAFDIGKIYEIEIGSVVGTHAGEGAVGVSYFRRS